MDRKAVALVGYQHRWATTMALVGFVLLVRWLAIRGAGGLLDESSAGGDG